MKILNAKIVYDGEVALKIMYTNEMGIFEQKELNVPFNFTNTLQGIKEGSNVSTDIDITKQDFVLLPDGNLEVQIDLMFNVNSSILQNINVIDEIVVEERNRDDMYSMVIYFVKSGDTLWKIAKKFGSTVDDIAKINDIQNIDLLQVGRQLYIPRYTNITA